MFSLILLILNGVWVMGQGDPFRIHLEPVDYARFPGVQAFAHGQHEGLTLIIGGRLDGLHRRQPPVTFDWPGHHRQLMVIDPATGEWWRAPLHSLPPAIREPLSATNMSFYQRDTVLWVVGGYGYSPTLDEHTTFPHLTRIALPEVIRAIREGRDFGQGLQQVRDPRLAVAGGYLRALGDTLYLVGGQRFEGRYNPMGPDHGPGFEQEYTNAVRRFVVRDGLSSPELVFLPEIRDTLAFHRRDYNVVPQILPGGKPGLTAFSGVFQVDADIPHLHAVDITADGYAFVPQFSQYLNHYHCAHLALYQLRDSAMHTVFFGGIAQYVEEGGQLVQDEEVPFVRTIARVTRGRDGIMREYKLPSLMPDLLGAGAEFIPRSDLPMLAHGIIDMDALEGWGDSVLLGYLYGGIHSSAPNIFFINDGEESIASPRLFRVWWKRATDRRDWLNVQSFSSLRWQMRPAGEWGDVVIRFYLEQPTAVQLEVHDSEGKLLYQTELPDITIGENTFQITLGEAQEERRYRLTLKAGEESAVQEVILRP